MPRGEARPMGMIRRTYGVPAGPLDAADDAAALRRSVQAFADAWYRGDDAGMLRCLHPDYVTRLISLGLEARPLGVQGGLGAEVPDGRRTVAIRILEVRRQAASVVAELEGWALHLHLARAAGQWRIVNAMWAPRA